MEQQHKITNTHKIGQPSSCAKLMLSSRSLKPTKSYLINLVSCHCSSPGLPERLASHYSALQNPVSASTTYTKAVQAFTESAVLAYECGYSESALKPRLEQKATQIADSPAYCMELVNLVWITLMLTQAGVVRWGMNPAVGEETLEIWGGFVSLIVRAYLERGMSGYPIDRLQTEILLSTGKAAEASLVAERARVVFTTLESVAPQFPSM